MQMYQQQASQLNVPTSRLETELEKRQHVKTKNVKLNHGQRNMDKSIERLAPLNS